MSTEETKPTFLQKLKISTPEACLSAIKNGWVAGLISIGLTLLMVLIGMFSNSENATVVYFGDPLMFIDLILMLIMVFFIFKKSRVAATSMFIYFLSSKYIQWTDLGEVQGLPMAMIFIALYFNAMRGTYLWHSKFKQLQSVE
ncbi:hypothetical protein [Pseudocolwellia agarivorans]|uniref:hypothetical protein n=1 Tax=Pseudocolwellia agarivorans TaxID=1911682 RepID=UPI0009848A2E|nr:hypothetical protein [Pseudocolwellia agarivorans]